MSVNINIVSDENKVEAPPEPQGVKIEVVEKDEIDSWHVEWEKDND